MKIGALSFLTLCVAVGLSCSNHGGIHGRSVPAEASASEVTGPPGPAAKDIEEAKRYVQAGMPFEVSIAPEGVMDLPVRGGELDHLKTKFLQPLAASKHAKRIERVVIDASCKEWAQWTCSVELVEAAPISLTHFAGFYDGRNNQDPDAYGDARSYVLRELHRIGERVGWE